MIEIIISRELADAHRGFMSHCADRGHAIRVFDSDASAARSHETGWAATDLAADHAAGVSMGDPTPGIENRTD